MRNLLSVNICRFSLNIHFSWAFILAKLLCCFAKIFLESKHQKDLKHLQKRRRGEGAENKQAFSGKRLLDSSRTAAVLFCPVLHLITCRKIESGHQWIRKRVRKTECQCEPVTCSVIRGSKSCTGQLKRTAPSYCLCPSERSPLHTNLRFWLIYLTYKFTLFFFFSLISPLYSAVGTTEPRIPQALHSCLWAPRRYRWHFFAYTDPMFRTASSKKERDIWLPAVAERTSKHKGTASKPDSCHAMLPSVVQHWQVWSNPLRKWRLLAWDLFF